MRRVNITDFHDIEATKLDYKVDVESAKPRSWLKSVSAFANTGGGHILFGVLNNTHKAVGLENAQEAVSKIAELIAGRIAPAPRYALSDFDSDTPGRRCIDLAIQSGPSYPYYYVHERVREAYVRRGDRSELATENELSALILRGQNKTFDALPSHYKPSDVSFTLLRATHKRETGEDLTFPRDLISMQLLTLDGQVTNGGLLLCDQGYLRQSKIVCTRWKGAQKGAIDGDALDDQEFGEASLITLLINAEAFIRNNSKSPWTVRGMTREEKSDYPLPAVREALINAVMHRDYQIVGTEVHVDMFDDRMEITSPGGMLSGARIQDMDLRRVPSMRRNEVISDIFGRLHYMDRRGSGISRILNTYASFTEQPMFFSDETFFSVLLPNRSVVEKTGHSSEKTQLPNENTQLSNENTQLRCEKTQLENEKTEHMPLETQLSLSEIDESADVADIELWRFANGLAMRATGVFRKRTIRDIKRLFARYRYDYSFNRRNIADFFGKTHNGASLFINKCMKAGLIEKEKRDSYKFIRQDEN